MEALGEQLQAIGTQLQILGLRLLPYSFFIYMPVRWLEYVWQKGYTRLVKGIWYASLGLGYLVGGVDTELIVIFICFIEASDLCFQQLEIGRQRRAERFARLKEEINE